MYTIIKRNILIRIVCIIIVGLLLGLVINQVHPRGIRLPVLISSLVLNSSQQGWRPISADSSFVLYMQKSAHFFDIRSREQFKLDHLKGARSLPFYEFMIHPEDFDLPEKESVIILYDFPPHSPKAPLMIRQLESRGYKEVFFLRNGYSQWLEYGFPIEKGENR